MEIYSFSIARSVKGSQGSLQCAGKPGRGLVPAASLSLIFSLPRLVAHSNGQKGSQLCSSLLLSGVLDTVFGDRDEKLMV